MSNPCPICKDDIEIQYTVSHAVLDVWVINLSLTVPTYMVTLNFVRILMNNSYLLC